MEIKQPYDPKKCERCGRCLMSCPVLEYSESEAKKEIGRLHSGDLKSPVLKACISCFTCNQACPNGLNVNGLILSLWHKKRTLSTMPWQVRVTLPHQRPPNVWTDIQKRFRPEERALVSSMEDDVSGKDVLFLGCNQLLNPYIAISPLLRDLPIAAARGVCCGEPYFRMGFLDGFKLSANSWLEHWRDRAPARMVVMCTACLNMFKNIYPAYIGDRPPFEVVSVFEWLDEKIEAGAIELIRPLGIKVLVQDSCHSKILGKGYRDLCRKLMEAAGARIIEADEGPGGSRCCGFVGAAANFSPLPMYKLSTARFGIAKKAGADAIAAYCNGCVLMLSMAGRLYPFRVPVYHLIEMLTAAAGHETESLHPKRSREIILTSLGVAAKKLPRPSTNVLDL